MPKREAQRVYRELTPEEQADLVRAREQVAQELPDLVRRNKMARDAAGEPTLSGELRRAIHSSRLSLSRIAHDGGITVLMLDEFLTGERTLPSDVLDRLAQALGYELKPVS